MILLTIYPLIVKENVQNIDISSKNPMRNIEKVVRICRYYTYTQKRET